MTQQQQQAPFPRAPLIGAALLLGISLLSVAAVRWLGEAEVAPLPAEPPQRVRELTFHDTDHGGVLVREADTGALVARVAYGSNGFLRSTMRGLARERRSRGIGSELPFRVQQEADGRLSLIDPATDRIVDLWAFGADNAKVFAHLLIAEPLPEPLPEPWPETAADTSVSSNPGDDATGPDARVAAVATTPDSRDTP